MVLCWSLKESSGADLESLFQLIFMRTEVEKVRIEKKVRGGKQEVEKGAG